MITRRYIVYDELHTFLTIDSIVGIYKTKAEAEAEVSRKKRKYASNPMIAIIEWEE